MIGAVRMIEIFKDLFIGNAADYEHDVREQPGWRVVHACKEPYHRQALGYTGRAAPQDHPEYLIARRGHRLILNLVDAPDPAYIRKAIAEAGIVFVHEGLRGGDRVLVHCNEGRSRPAMIGFLSLASFTDRLPPTFDAAEAAFRAIYPPYLPGAGVRGFLVCYFDKYRNAS